MTSASIECLDIAILLGSFQYRIIVGAYSWVHRIKRFDILGRLSGRCIDDLGESESGDTIDDSEIDRFRDTSELRGDMRLFPEEKSRRTGVYILSSGKCFYE